MREYPVSIPHNSLNAAPWQCMKWLEQQGWLNHRMVLAPGGTMQHEFLDWDLVPPHHKHHETYVFRDPNKAMMFKLAMGGV